MTEPNRDREADVDRFVKVYYQAIESGDPIERDSLIAENPDFAEELRSFFADIGNLDAVSEIGELEWTLGLDGRRFRDSANRLVEPGDSLTYIGDYRILEEIARGGMGVVYKARQEKLGRFVALKMILSGPFASGMEIERFCKEARSAAKLQDPNIVSVHEIGLYAGYYYFTMDYIESDSLAKRLREGSLSAEESARWVESIALAMSYAHQEDVIHRDLKPENILVDTSGQPHITDFCLAKAQADADQETPLEMTRTGQILGTPRYMSPEQAAAKHQPVGVASDVYSLGAILDACRTGRAPFVGESPVATLRQVIENEVVPLRTLNPKSPKDLENVCHKCLQKEPHRRYGTSQVAAIAGEHLQALSEEPIDTTRVQKAPLYHLAATTCLVGESNVDVCVYGGAALGAITAVQAARMGKSDEGKSSKSKNLSNWGYSSSSPTTSHFPTSCRRPCRNGDCPRTHLLTTRIGHTSCMCVRRAA